MKRTVRIVMTLLLVAVIAIGMVACKGSSSETSAPIKVKTAKLAYIAAIDSAVDIAFKKLADDVLEKTGGSLVIQLFPASMLGTETELKDMVSIGSVQMVSSGWSLLMTSQPDSLAFFGYYQLLDEDELNAFYTSDVAKAIYDYHEEKTGVRVLASNYFQGMRHTAAKKPFTNLDELKGIKIRVPAGAPLDVQSWTAWGALPTPLAFSEVYSSLQTGVIDACEVPLEFIYNNSLYDHAPYIMLTGHQMYNNLVVANADWVDSLSEKEQQVLLECLEKAGDYETQLLKDNLDEMIEDMKSKGCTFVELSEDVKKEMGEKVAAIYKDQQQKSLELIGFEK